MFVSTLKQSFVLGLAIVATGCTDETDVARVNDAGTTTDSATTDSATTDTGTLVEDTGGTEVAVDAGTEKDCLEGTGVDGFFTIEDTSKCVVAKYDVPTGRLGNLSWGRHGGPLGFAGGATPAVIRYELPTAATGAVTIKKTDVPVTGVAAGVFWGGSAYDLPFFGWTAFGYTGSGAGFPGEVILVNAAGALTRYHANGFYAAAAVGNATGGRLVHTSVGPLTTMKGTDNAGGVYAADSCGTNKLLPEGDATCTAPKKLATWEAGASGPVASDPNDNVFAILSKFGGKQELRGFEKSTIARGAGEAAGNTIFSDDQYTGDLVADGKAVYWQPNDPAAFAPLDPMMLAYTVDGKKISPSGAAKTFLKLKTAGSNVTMFRDATGRIYVGMPQPAAGDAGPTSSVLFVLRAKKPYEEVERFNGSKVERDCRLVRPSTIRPSTSGATERTA